FTSARSYRSPDPALASPPTHRREVGPDQPVGADSNGHRTAGGWFYASAGCWRVARVPPALARTRRTTAAVKHQPQLTPMRTRAGLPPGYPLDTTRSTRSLVW